MAVVEVRTARDVRDHSRVLRRLGFELRYRLSRPRWDTGIVPPEVRQLVEEERPTPGRALDLGCGTGTTAVYLATRGWDVVGVDFAPRAIGLARRRAADAGVADRVRFEVADVTRLPGLGAPFDLALDIGCFHAVPDARRRAYMEGVARVLRPGATVLMYEFLRRDGGPGVREGEIGEVFERDFELVAIDRGEEAGLARPSAWYRLRRR